MEHLKALFCHFDNLSFSDLDYLLQNRQEMADFLQETIEDHRKTFDPSNLRDLLDTYLQEIEKAIEEGTDRHLFEGKDHGK